jgi:nitrite reductase/ring-hydroxylating ferredoxin subunit
VTTREENELITRVGPGTPMGNALRRYWMPALLASELPGPDCPPVRVKLLGEELVAFRDTAGRVGLIEEFCPHRLASLFLGRNEEHGLRCVYHGWKFDVAGACVDMPNEPAASSFKDRIHTTAYPVEEKGGVVWAYMGPPEKKPELPDQEWMRAPATHSFVSVTHEFANFVQTVEGGIDTAHSSFLHNNNLSDKTGFRQIATAPRLEVVKTPYGFQYASLRDIGNDDIYLRLYTFVMPFHQMRASQIQASAGEGGGRRAAVPTNAGHMWVPIDDENTLVFNWMYATDPEIPFPEGHVEKAETNLGRGQTGEGRIRHRLRANDWLVDREMQRTENFSGIFGVNSQDLAVQESMGAIVPRWREHLGSTDLAVIAYRGILMDTIKSVQAGNDPPGVDPDTYRKVRASDMVIKRGTDWRQAVAQATVAQI